MYNTSFRLRNNFTNIVFGEHQHGPLPNAIANEMVKVRIGATIEMKTSKFGIDTNAFQMTGTKCTANTFISVKISTDVCISFCTFPHDVLV